MVRWAHKTLRSTQLWIGRTAYHVDSDGVIATAEGDDPAPEHIAVMRQISEFTQVQVASPAKPAKAPEPAPVVAQEPEPVPEPKPAPKKPKAAAKRGRPAAKKKKQG